MDSFEALIDFLVDRVETVSQVDTIIGEPFEAGGRRFVPLIEVRMGFFGAGFDGTGNATETKSELGASGSATLGATGGGIRIKPVGVIYQEADEAHFLSLTNEPSPAAAFLKSLPNQLFKRSQSSDDSGSTD